MSERRAETLGQDAGEPFPALPAELLSALTAHDVFMTPTEETQLSSAKNGAGHGVRNLPISEKHRAFPGANGNRALSNAPQIPDDGGAGMHVMTHVMKRIIPAMVELVAAAAALPAAALDCLNELQYASP